MRISAVIETLNIVFNSINLNSTLLGSFSQQNWIMYSLSPRRNLLSSHKKVIGTGEIIIVWTRHRVERSRCFWVSVQEVEISAVFFTHNLSQFTFHVR